MKNPLKKAIQLYKDISIEKKSMIWYTICNICQKGIAFVTVPIITRLLSPAEYGKYSVFLSWKDILIIFATLNLYCGVFTKILVDNKDNQDLCTSSMQGLGALSTLIMAAVYIPFHKQIENLSGFSTLVITLLLVYFFFYPSFSLWCTKQRVNNKYILMVTATLITSLLTPITSIILILKTNLLGEAVIIGNLVIYIAAGFIFFIINIKNGKKLYNKKYWIFALKYNIPLIPHYLSIMVLTQSDRLMIKHFCSDAEAGIYSLSYQISMVMNAVFNGINSAYNPYSYKLMHDRKTDLLRRDSTKIILFSLAITLLAIIIAPEFVLFMGGREYLPAQYIVPPVCLSAFITFYYGFFANVEFYHSKTKGVMLASTVSALANIVLNYLFIPRFGFIAAGYTTLASYLLLLIFHYTLSRKISIKEYGKPIYTVSVTAIITVTGITVSLILLLLYNYIIIRYAIVFAVLLICFIFKNKLIKFVKEINQ